MAKEDKNQKIIRALLQKPENKACFDCGEKGPVYVATEFGVFICTTCSGLHRELNHRVKSISMATFKPEEIEKLKNTGNEVARKYWLATWDPSQYPLPDSQDISRLKEFMRLKYEARKWVERPRDERAPPPSTSASAYGSGGGYARQATAAYSNGDRWEPKFTDALFTPGQEPTPEPLTNILGRDIPPLNVQPLRSGAAQSTPASATYVPPVTSAPPVLSKPVAQKPPAQPAPELIDFNPVFPPLTPSKPAAATTTTTSSTPTPILTPSNTTTTTTTATPAPTSQNILDILAGPTTTTTSSPVAPTTTTPLWTGTPTAPAAGGSTSLFPGQMGGGTMAAQMGAQMGGGVMAGRSGMPMVAGGAGGVPMGGVPMMASAGAGGMPIMAGGAATAPAGTPAMMGAFPAAGGYVPPMTGVPAGAYVAYAFPGAMPVYQPPVVFTPGTTATATPAASGTATSSPAPAPKQEEPSPFADLNVLKNLKISSPSTTPSAPTTQSQSRPPQPTLGSMQTGQRYVPPATPATSTSNSAATFDPFGIHSSAPQSQSTPQYIPPVTQSPQPQQQQALSGQWNPFM